MPDPQHMDPDVFDGRFDVSFSEGDMPDQRRLIIAGTNERVVITGKPEQFRNLAHFILEQSGYAPADSEES